MLSAVQIKSAKPKASAYKLADSGGLFLLVQPNGAKLWRYKFRIGGVEGLDALGAFPEVGLAEARLAHLESRRLVSESINPVLARREKSRRWHWRSYRATTAPSPRWQPIGLPQRRSACDQRRSSSARARSTTTCFPSSSIARLATSAAWK